MYKYLVYVTLKNNVLDPQGKAIEQAAKNMKIKNISSIKQGKLFEIAINSKQGSKSSYKIIEKLTEELLVNEIIEDYKIVSVKKS
tara:strand:+ start:1458 stop:1712 length:255 start_codon:yes stop_codon:yes gene_type:complete